MCPYPLPITIGLQEGQIEGFPSLLLPLILSDIGREGLVVWWGGLAFLFLGSSFLVSILGVVSMALTLRARSQTFRKCYGLKLTCHAHS
jgi:hypothetical protein